MTAIADPPAVTAEPPADESSIPSGPVATMSADLMPDEILVKRRLGYLKRRLVFVMAALVALVVLGDMLVRQQTSSAGAGLAAANDHIAALNKQLNHFSPMLATQSETQAIQTQLDGVMGTDVSWPALLEKVSAPAPAGLTLNTVTAQVNNPNSTTGSSSTSTTGVVVADQVGSLTLSGTATTWKQVASYVRGLSAIKGFTAVNPSTVASGVGALGGSSHSSVLSFTVTVDLTSATLSNRYISPDASTSAAIGATPPGTTLGSTTAASAPPSASAAAGTTSRSTSSPSASTISGADTGSSQGSSTSPPAQRKNSSSSSRGTQHTNATSGSGGPAQNIQESS